MQFLLVIIYVVVGIVLAIPYCLLAGWNTHIFPLVVILAPALFLVWFISGVFAGILKNLNHFPYIMFSSRAAFGRGEGKAWKDQLFVFWMFTFIGLLPIIFNWGSIVVEIIGYEKIASFINKNRYASPIYASVVIYFFIILTEMINKSFNRVKSWLGYNRS